MTHELSIIIPSYNCEKTLREAVDSCYVQDLTEDEFEIIMVDDGSSDNTRHVMELIKTQHSNISLLFHEENKGGGAARNTGIAAAKGEIIYCLDSDNFFAPLSVKPMLNFLLENRLDGVAFYERRFFLNNNLKKFTAHINSSSDVIELSDIFNGSGTLLDNFFFTKSAYAKTAGYPEHHGFDTQCFEIRFLSIGNTVGVCPDSIFWHRQAGGEKSYFERVYESGEYSLNMYYIMEDVMHLLSDKARVLVLSFDIFGKSKLGEDNLLSALTVLFKENKSSLFRHDYQKYVKPDGLMEYLETEGSTDCLMNAIYSYQQTDYQEASRLFQLHLAEHGPSAIIYYNVLRCAVGASGVEKNLIEKNTLRTSQSFGLKKQKIDLDPNILKRLLYTIYNQIK
jgi:glycosyltransferase involved in cell wall biosynthesis